MMRFLVVAFLLFVIPVSALRANGGDMRVTDDGHFLALLSKAPYTPRAGSQTNFLLSFLNLHAGMSGEHGAHSRAIREPVLIKLRIAKMSASAPGEHSTIYETELRADGGIVEFPYTFEGAGLHEIFIELAFASDPQTWYTFPDFLLDVQPRPVSVPFWPLVMSGGALGLVIGSFIGYRFASRRP